MTEFVDAEERNKQYPKTFDIPAESERNNVKRGDYVKLIFDDKERMWVKVKKHKGKKLIGVINNEPVLIEDVKFGDKVEFEPKNIIDIMRIYKKKLNDVV